MESASDGCFRHATDDAMADTASVGKELIKKRHRARDKKPKNCMNYYESVIENKTFIVLIVKY